MLLLPDDLIRIPFKLILNKAPYGVSQFDHTLDTAQRGLGNVDLLHGGILTEVHVALMKGEAVIPNRRIGGDGLYIVLLGIELFIRYDYIGMDIGERVPQLIGKLFALDRSYGRFLSAVLS